MIYKTILILCLVLFFPLISAQSQEFSIELKPNYFKDGRGALINTPYNGIVFEIIGTNSLEKSRILEIQIINASPQIFKDALPKNITESLRILQQKTLWTSDLMNINDFFEGNITFWIEVKGRNEKTSEELIYTDSTILFIKEFKEQKDPWIISLGDKIWEDNPFKGIGVLVIILFIGFFIFWKYGVSDKLEEWRGRTEKRRTEKRQGEEGY